jgi:hypothetical protein
MMTMIDLFWLASFQGSAFVGGVAVVLIRDWLRQFSIVRVVEPQVVEV